MGGEWSGQGLGRWCCRAGIGPAAALRLQGAVAIERVGSGADAPAGPAPPCLRPCLCLQDRKQVEDQIRKQFPPFKSTKEFEFGFKIRWGFAGAADRHIGWGAKRI